MSNSVQLKYGAEVQNVTHNSGQIILTVTPPDDPIDCKSITIDVPIGDRAEDMFTKPAVIKSNRGNWAPTGCIPTAPATAEGGQTPTTYQRFVVYNHQTDYTLGFSKDTPLVITITGSVNTVKSSVKPTLLLEEISAADKSYFSQTLPTKQSIDLEKAHSQLLFIESFYASDGSADSAKEPNTAKGLGVKPITKFRSGESFKLSWESNGTNYELYHGDKLAVLNPGETNSHELPAGISSDTTFVLYAIQNNTHLYASLTVTVSNPIFGPEPDFTNTLKSTLGQIAGAQLRHALESQRLYGKPADGSLNTALANTSDNLVKKLLLEMPRNQVLPLREYRSSDEGPGREYVRDYKQTVLSADKYRLRFWLLTPENGNPALQAALQATTDLELKSALQSQYPDLNRILEFSSDEDLKTAIQELPDATLILLFDEPGIGDLGPATIAKIRAATAEATEKLIFKQQEDNFKQLDDNTTHAVRLNDGTPHSNIVLQALTGSNSGLATLNFNGYTSGGEKQFNPAKARYRVGTDQRGVTDQFFIDTYSKGASSSKQAFTITADGNVGIGTTTPIAPLHVIGAVTGNDVTQNIAYFCQGSDFTKGTAAAGNTRTLSAYFEGGQFWVNSCIVAGAMNVSSDRRIKHIVGLSDCAADLDLLKKIRVTDYTYIDKLVNTDRVMKKVIAQEIQGLMPSAVNTSTQAVPNVYERAAHVSFADGRVTVTAAKAHELPATGGKMRLYTPANIDVSADATVVDAHTFSFASNEAYEAGLFVYGKFVDDFLSVDYDAVAMLNVSATQALARQVEELHQQNAVLNEQHLAQGTQVDELRTALHLLQQQVASLLSQPAGIAQPV